MTNEINNCGLVALRNISDLKSISVRTLINLAEDNGIKLYAYKLTKKEIETVGLPAIFHSDNHFVYVVDKQDLQNYNITGDVLFTNKQRYKPVRIGKTKSIVGQWVAAGVASAALTLAAAKWFSGNRKEKRAKKERERLATPFYKVQDEYYKNQNLAEGVAQGGLAQPTKDYYSNQAEKGMSVGVTGILAGGGNPNDVSKLYETYDNGVEKIASADAAAHLDNIKYYMGVNKDMAAQKNIQWGLNVKQPNDNLRRELSAAQKAGEAMKWEAASDAMSAVSSFGTSVSGSGGFGKNGGFGNGSGAKKAGSDSSAGAGGGYGYKLSDSSDYTKMFSNKSVAPTPHTNDPFGNDETDFAKYQQWLQFQEQQGERKGGW